LGFTLIGDLVPPTVLATAHLATRGHYVDARAVEPAFSAATHLLSDVSAWADDTTITTMLTTFYRTVIERLADLPGEEVATAVIADYTRPSSWRAYDGALTALETVKRLGLPVAVFSNWQSNLADVLSAAGLSGAIDGRRYAAPYR